MRDPTNPFAPLDNAGWMSMDERKEASDKIAALEANLHKAVEVMRELADRWEILCDVIKPLINDDAYVAARAFLATMEQTPKVEKPHEKG